MWLAGVTGTGIIDAMPYHTCFGGDAGIDRCLSDWVGGLGALSDINQQLFPFHVTQYYI